MENQRDEHQEDGENGIEEEMPQKEIDVSATAKAKAKAPTKKVEKQKEVDPEILIEAKLKSRPGLERKIAHLWNDVKTVEKDGEEKDVKSSYWRVNFWDVKGIFGKTKVVESHFVKVCGREVTIEK